MQSFKNEFFSLVDIEEKLGERDFLKVVNFFSLHIFLFIFTYKDVGRITHNLHANSLKLPFGPNSQIGEESIIIYGSRGCSKKYLRLKVLGMRY